ncbi:MAG TPA: enoyl-CoA hydratase/isomerase family protein [Acidimicrobiales bacterium]|nr:enoyl-CoA hydratase/isomerase family protein [Acidimicrobiales bacterium]
MPLDDGVVDLAAFGELLGGPDRDAPPSGTAPLVVVDLDSGGRPARLPEGRPSEAWRRPRPFVAVGVSRSPPAGAPLELLDVVLTDDRGSPAPWVSVPDLAGELEEIRSAASRAPRAAVALAQVLRTGEGLPFADAVVLESLAYSTLQAGPEFARWLAGRPACGPRPPESSVLRLERAGAELRLVLDRPHVRNAIDAALRDALCDGLEVALADPGVASVVIAGRGPDVCSGGDLREFGTAPDPATAHLLRTRRSPATLVDALADRVTARLHGACVGAGIEIAAAAGRVLAAPGTRIWLPELAMGLVPGAGGTVSVPRRIGRHRTAWLALTGRALDAAAAFEWGLVDAVEAG